MATLSWSAAINIMDKLVSEKAQSGVQEIAWEQIKELISPQVLTSGLADGTATVRGFISDSVSCKECFYCATRGNVEPCNSCIVEIKQNFKPVK